MPGRMKLKMQHITARGIGMAGMYFLSFFALALSLWPLPSPYPIVSFFLYKYCKINTLTV